MNPDNKVIDKTPLIAVSGSFLIQLGIETLVSKRFQSHRTISVTSSADLLNVAAENPNALFFVHLRKSSPISFPAIVHLTQQFPNCKSMVILSDGGSTTIEQIVQHKLSCCIHEDESEKEWMAAFAALSAGNKFYSSQLLQNAFDYKFGTTANSYRKELLTERQIEILKEVANGQTNKAIADRLKISPHTVHTHRKNMMKKLGIHSASGLVIYAIRSGLINPNENQPH